MQNIILIFSINDVYIPNNFPKLKAFIEDLVLDYKDKGYSPKTFVTLNGDFLLPSFLSSMDGGLNMISAMNEFITHVCLGNHEFDAPNLPAKLLNTKFKILNSNVLTKDSEDIGIPYEIDSIGDLQICLVGLCTEDTPSMALNSDPYRFLNGNDSIINIVTNTKLSEKKYVIALTHQSIDKDRVLAESGAVDLILGGHEHDFIVEFPLNKKGREIPIVKVGSNAEYIGVIDVNPTTLKSNVRYYKTDDYTREDPTLAQYVAQQKSLIASLEDIVLLKFDSMLSTSEIRKKSSSFIQYLGYTLCTKYNCDAFLINAGAIRNEKDFKELSVADLYKMLPYDDILAKVTVPSDVLLKTIEMTNSKCNGRGKFLQCYPLNLEKLGQVCTILLPNSILKGINRQEPLLSWYEAGDQDYVAVDGGNKMKKIIVETLNSHEIPVPAEPLNKTIEDPDLSRCKALRGAKKINPLLKKF